MKVLITGASGHLAKTVARELGECDLVYLTTSKAQANSQTHFLWNPQRSEIDGRCVDGVTHVVHLAGKSIKSRWTEANKRAILSSRVDGARLIFEACKERGVELESFVSAGGVAVYGDGWLSGVCREWEAAAERFREIGARVVVMRLPVLIDKESSFVRTVKPAARLGLAVSFGSSAMKFPWAHTKDVARFVRHAIENQTNGSYPLIAAEPTQGELQKVLARNWAGLAVGLTVPAFLVKIAFGAKSEILLTEHRINLEVTQNTGFKFLLVDLSSALNE